MIAFSVFIFVFCPSAVIPKMSRTAFKIFCLLLGVQLLFILSFIHYQGYYVKNWTFVHSEKVDVTQISNLTPKVKVNYEELTVWNLTRKSMLSEDRGPNQTSKPSKRRQDFLLLVRKLALFSVREINRRISEEECGHWWVNPLSVQRVEQRLISLGQLTYGLTFQIQPGNIPFRTNVLVEKGGGGVSPGTHLVYLNGTRLDQLPQECGIIPEHVRNLCLCPEEMEEAENVTTLLRGEWAKTDPELFSWPPNVPMWVSDYIRFGDTRLYLKTPSDKTEYCDPTVKMIVFISSAPTHALQRRTIRKTFGNPEILHPMGVRVLFLFGTITNQTLQSEINEEFNLYEDIVQADYADSYHNLSLSHLSMYNWVVTRCAGDKVMPKWVFKADDDFFLNPPLALRIAEQNPDIEFLGMLFCGTKAIRDLAYMTKYYVPRYMYAPDWYAGYLSGVAYMVQSRTFKRILAASGNVPLIHMDDCYVMGLLTKEAEIRPRGSNLFNAGRPEPDACRTKLTASSYAYNSTDMEVQWDAYSLPMPNTCPFNETIWKVLPLDQSTNYVCFYE